MSFSKLENNFCGFLQKIFSLTHLSRFPGASKLENNFCGFLQKIFSLTHLSRFPGGGWWLPRRTTQLTVLALLASPLFGLTFFRGNLAAADLFGLPLADPLAFLQVLIGGKVIVLSYLGSALLVMLFYFFFGGRSFCGWICPVGFITELGEKLRCRLGSGAAIVPLVANRWSLGFVLVAVALTAVPLFEVFSPIGIVSRAIAFAALKPLLLLAAILLIEIAVARRIWCRSLCPLGGFYSLLARFSPLRVGFVKERCTHCNDCLRTCPVDEVLAAPLEKGAGQVTAGDCSRCFACIDICPTRALTVELFFKQ
jgi:ferredoxin-type protein NapH